MKVKIFVLRMFLLLISVGIAFSSYKISTIITDYKKSEALYDSIAENAIVTTEDKETKNGEGEKPLPFSVDFQSLKAMNNEIVAWLYCEGTTINYPVVLGDNNSYYLSHLPDGTGSSSGTLFFDCGNNFKDKHLLIYGHNMKNGSMFASLGQYSSQDYYKQHPTFILCTEKGCYELQVYSAYYTTDNDYTYSLDSGKESNALEYANYAHNRSCIATDVVFDKDDTIITLSTCAFISGYNRFVVQCVLKGELV